MDLDFYRLKFLQVFNTKSCTSIILTNFFMTPSTVHFLYFLCNVNNSGCIKMFHAHFSKSSSLVSRDENFRNQITQFLFSTGWYRKLYMIKWHFWLVSDIFLYYQRLIQRKAFIKLFRYLVERAQENKHGQTLRQ